MRQERPTVGGLAQANHSVNRPAGRLSRDSESAGQSFVDSARVGITHDFLEAYGGAERVTEEIARTFPRATVTTLLARPAVVDRMGLVGRCRSLLPSRSRLLRSYRGLAPIYPAIVRANPLDDVDVIVSSSYAFAHHFRSRNGAPQVCYCHSPLRFAWSMTDAYRQERARTPFARFAFSGMARYMQAVDRRAAQRVDKYVTHSDHVAAQIEQFYYRDAEIIGAPVDCDVFVPSGRPPDDYWLFVGRLVEPYKRLRQVIEAFKHLPEQRLLVAGNGPAYAELVSGAPPNVTFLGYLRDHELIPLLQHCRAAIFPSKDDFGLIPVEVAACGRPVLAFAGGGALRTVVPGVTGEIFSDPTAEGIERAIEAFDADRYDPELIRKHARQWDRKEFRRRLLASVESVLERTH